MQKKELIPLAIIAVMFLVGFSVLPHLPDEVPSHFAEYGVANAFTSGVQAAFLIPILSLIAYFFFILVPKTLIHKKSTLQFYMHHIDGIETAFFLFMFVIYLALLGLVMGHIFDIALVIAPAFSVFLYYYGYLLKFAVPGFPVAIRTPWSIRNYEVWKSTQLMGSLTFRITAVITFFAFLVPNYFFIIFLGPIFANVMFLLIYSRSLYQDLPKERPRRTQKKTAKKRKSRK